MTGWLGYEPNGWWGIVEDALAEDLGPGDLSTLGMDPNRMVEWEIEAQERGVVCGVGIAASLLGPIGPDSGSMTIDRRDGDIVDRGDVILAGKGSAVRLLQLERTALNFLMQLSGVATLTAKYVDRVKGLPVRIVDTRKTVPMMRQLQKYAVRCGGGYNHRMGLYDAVMIKDNHIAAHGSISRAVSVLRALNSHTTRIEVECENPEQVEEAIQSGADIIMLDNMDPFTMRSLVSRFKGQAIFEASGGISLDTVRGVAETGVDVISVGALTHSASSLSLHMEFRD